MKAILILGWRLGPIPLPVNLKHYSWQSHCNGLFEQPVAA